MTLFRNKVIVDAIDHDEAILKLGAPRIQRDSDVLVKGSNLDRDTHMKDECEHELDLGAVSTSQERQGWPVRPEAEEGAWPESP